MNECTAIARECPSCGKTLTKEEIPDHENNELVARLITRISELEFENKSLNQKVHTASQAPKSILKKSVDSDPLSTVIRCPARHKLTFRYEAFPRNYNGYSAPGHEITCAMCKNEFPCVIGFFRCGSADCGDFDLCTRCAVTGVAGPRAPRVE